MNLNFSQLLEIFGKNFRLLNKSKHGFERECMRVTQDGDLAQTPHPKTLGSAFANPYITTDFSEAQLELITPPLSNERETLSFVDQIYTFVSHNLKG